MTHQVLQTLSTHGVVAAGITAPSAAPPPFQLSNDGAFAAPLGATLGEDASVQGSVASVLHNLSGEPLGWGLRLQDRTGPGMFLPPRIFSLIAESLPNLKPKYGLMNILIFGLLLANSPTEPQYHLSVTTSAASGSPGLPTLCVEPTRQSP